MGGGGGGGGGTTHARAGANAANPGVLEGGDYAG